MWAVIIRNNSDAGDVGGWICLGLSVCFFFLPYTSGLNECPKWEEPLWNFGRSAIFGPSSPSATPGLDLNTNISTTGIRHTGNLGVFMIFKVHFPSKVTLILALDRGKCLFKILTLNVNRPRADCACVRALAPPFSLLAHALQCISSSSWLSRAV